MVISLRRQPHSTGPQLGPDPAWANFYRTEQPGGGGVHRVKVQAIKPDITAYRVLGDCTDEVLDAVDRVRNRYNSSVYVARLDSFSQRPKANTVRLPVVGEIAAGQYDVTVAYQEYDCLDYEGGIAVDRAMSRNGAYALRVRGTSMTHVGIEPGDVVIVKPQSWAEDGDFVVASYAGEAGGSEGLATLKRFYKRKDHVFLQSATASTDPIRLFANRREGAYDSDPVRIQGIVTMVLKAS
ncbi:MAG: repressor LexA [Chloroflexia bacterium]|nr:repressor LexA [Chloroflexia bacterium]